MTAPGHDPAGTGADVVVVGGGPAGALAAVAALRVDPDLRVVLVDRADFPRDKSCGDGIAAQAVDVLRDHGLADVVDGWTPLRRLELAIGDTLVDGRMARDVHVIPRRVLDARLVERAVARGAHLERRRVTGTVTRATGPVEVRDDHDGLRAAVVVGADGAHSRVRASLAGRTGRDRLPPGRRALALRGYAPTPSWLEGRQVIRYGPRRQPSYAWAFDRGDGLANVGYGELVDDGRGRTTPTTRAGLLDGLEQLLPGLVATGGDWRGHPLPLSGFRWPQPDGPVLLAGDASGLINPMTGEGIYYAVATGALAGRAAAEAVLAGRPDRAGARYRADVRRLLGAHLRHTWAAGRLSQDPRVVAAGVRAASHDQRVFDDLVEIGLGGGRITPRLGRALATRLVRPGAGDPTPRPTPGPTP